MYDFEDGLSCSMGEDDLTKYDLTTAVEKNAGDEQNFGSSPIS